MRTARKSFYYFVKHLRGHFSRIFSDEADWNFVNSTRCIVIHSYLCTRRDFPKQSKNHKELRNYFENSEPLSKHLDIFDFLWKKYERYLDSGFYPTSYNLEDEKLFDKIQLL